MKRKPHLVTIGAPPVPFVNREVFKPFNRETIEAAWQLVGPSVARNLGYFQTAPLWMIFAACYAEGAKHAALILREKT